MSNCCLRSAISSGRVRTALWNHSTPVQFFQNARFTFTPAYCMRRTHGSTSAWVAGLPLSSFWPGTGGM